MYTEDQLLPISALQHLLFCERQCALIHIEQVWAENRFTVEGQHLHRKAHAAGAEKRRAVRTARGLALRSFQLGLVGKADIVEFQQADAGQAAGPPSVRRPSRESLTSGHWLVTPVEYKRGKPKTNDSDRVQLCAQALCLEEMLAIPIPAGALYYGQKRRRTEVLFDATLRSLTTRTAARLHALIASQQTPPARREPKCETCSLLPLCMPDVFRTAGPMSVLVSRCFRQHIASTGPHADRDDADSGGAA